MRTLILYVATSLDGKIAKPDGDVKWLESLPNPEQDDYGYADFYKSIDTTVMGHNTYKEILGFDIPFPYQDKKNFVITRNKDLKDTEHVSFVSDDPVGFMKELKAASGGPIWLVGGAQLNTLFFNEGLIDELMVFTMPIVIGDGIPLFSPHPIERLLKVKAQKTYTSGVVMTSYLPSN